MKKKAYFFLPLIVTSLSLLSQDKTNIQRAAIGAHFFFNQFKSAGNSSNRRFENVKPGLAISYMTGLSMHCDVVGTLSGSYVNYPPDKTNIPISTKEDLLIETDVAIRYKLLSNTHIIVPYIQAGMGFSGYDDIYGLYIPAGIGVQVKLLEEAFLIGNMQFRWPFANTQAEHFYYSIGIAGTIGKIKKKKPVPIVHRFSEPPQRNGIRDSDGDGIMDNEDACPYLKGSRNYNGCPIPDSDGDGINDEEDSCPHTPGFVRYHGCPIPDRDGDGINDEEDKCPDIAGTASNSGCPEIKKDLLAMVNLAAQNIFFETNKYVLLPRSFSSLDSVVIALQSDRNLKLNIEGHTDSMGSIGKNKILSKNRAITVEKYFIQKGIIASRLHAVGYGMEKPIADNKTSDGRTKNRRVELKIFYN